MEVTDFIPGDWREWRRLRALHLKQRGWYQRDIAEALGASEETVSRWLARDGGPGIDRHAQLMGIPRPAGPSRHGPLSRRATSFQP